MWNLRKKDAYQEGLMEANWAQLKKQNKKQSLAGISKPKP